MNQSGNSLMTLVNRESITRRAMLLALPGIAFAPRLLAQHQVTPLTTVGLQQITLAVSDIERSLAFYQELFGVSVQARHERSVLLLTFLRSQKQVQQHLVLIILVWEWTALT